MKTYHRIILFLVAFAPSVGLSQNWQDTLNTARKAYNAGHYKEALKYYKSADKLAPNNVDLSSEKGQSAFKAGDFETAVESYKDATHTVKSKNQKVKAYTNLGNAQLKNKEFGAAVESLKEALRNDPSSEKARQLLAEAQRLKKKQEEEAKKNEQKKQDEQKQQQGNKEQQQQKQSGQSNQNQQNQDSKSQKSDQQNGQLQDKQTDRKLDDLQRQEMMTKKRINGSKGKKGGSSAGKDW